jgi:hypothetical protein
MKRAVLMILALLAAAPAFAQQTAPLPPIVLDVRGFMTGVGPDPASAIGLNLPASDLPGRVRGLSGGVTFYPMRRQGMSLGIAGELVLGRGRRTTTDTTGATPDIKTATRLTAWSGNVSLNFGTRNGWSYVTAGYGPTYFATYLDDGVTAHVIPRDMVPNAGGGARWFSSKHVAFEFDVRLYFTSPLAATDVFSGHGRRKLTVLSAGISIR